MKKEDKEMLRMEALIRIKDGGLLHDDGNRRIKLLLKTLYWLNMRVTKVGKDTDIIVAVREKIPSNAHKLEGLPPEKRKVVLATGYRIIPPFNEVLAYAKLAIERFVLLIDPNAKVEIDFPNFPFPENIQQIEYNSFNTFDNNDFKENRSDFIPEEIMAKVDDYIDFVIKPSEHLLGICHSEWEMKKLILLYIFHLHWLSPAQRHPNIHFD